MGRLLVASVGAQSWRQNRVVTRQKKTDHDKSRRNPQKVRPRMSLPSNTSNTLDTAHFPCFCATSIQRASLKGECAQ